MIPRTIALLLVAIAVPVLAEEVAEQVDTIVVTGSRATDQQAEIPNTMTVIRLEEIEAQNPVSVPECPRRAAIRAGRCGEGFCSRR
jgi:outer membrane cobalamin receptor